MSDYPTQSSKQGEIPLSIQELRSAVDALEKTAGRLIDKLADTLRPCPPTNPSASPGLPPSVSPVGGSIRALAMRVFGINDGIQDLLDRCEL